MSTLFGFFFALSYKFAHPWKYKQGQVVANMWLSIFAYIWEWMNNWMNEWMNEQQSNRQQNNTIAVNNNNNTVASNNNTVAVNSNTVAVNSNTNGSNVHNRRKNRRRQWRGKCANSWTKLGTHSGLGVKTSKRSDGDDWKESGTVIVNYFLVEMVARTGVMDNLPGSRM